MTLRKYVRRKLIENLWQATTHLPHVKSIISALCHHDCAEIILDHFAIIDLPGKNSGIPALSQLFSWLGYAYQGEGYLPEKQNDFQWLAEVDALSQPVAHVLPQVVIADFRLHELPVEVSQIIEKYSAQVPVAPITQMQALMDDIDAGEHWAAERLLQQLTNYFSGRAWALPTVAEFEVVQACNELLAWVLLFGRIPNHFGIAIHLMEGFTSLDSFMTFLKDEVQIPLNEIDGRIKGHASQGIRQGASKGEQIKIQLADGECLIPGQFMEFVWRYPIQSELVKPSLWGDYYTGFIPQNANRVIESLYSPPPMLTQGEGFLDKMRRAK